jgi:hypothetical protein
VSVRFHPHALERMAERGATEAEARTTIESGERFAGKFGRTGFRRNFAFGGTWRGRVTRPSSSRSTRSRRIVIGSQSPQW